MTSPSRDRCWRRRPRPVSAGSRFGRRSVIGLLYDPPAKPIESGDTLSFYDPIKLQSVEISSAPSCTADGSGNGWGLEKGRIRICGDACTQLRDALKAQAAIAGQANTTPPAIPVFARKAVCKQ